MKLVDGTDARARNTVPELEDLGIVGRNDQNAFEANRVLDAFSIDPRGRGGQDPCHEIANHFSFLG